jgi:aryl-alcohol dehydrogenase-like predicted oxidoreductase
MQPFTPVRLGRTARTVGRIGLGSSYGIEGSDVERAFEHGINYFYWGSRRTHAFGQGLRNLRPHRERWMLVIQSYSRMGGLIPWSLKRALRKVGTDYADVLLLGLWGKPVPPRILEPALDLQRKGLVRTLAVSTHKRALAPELARNPGFGILHVRYNAAHLGAERDIFPHLETQAPPGVVAFTATSWGQLMDSRFTPSGLRTPTATDCYRFCLSHQAVNVCMAGPANGRELDSAIAALRLGPMTPDELAWMRQVGSEVYRRAKPRF